MNELTNHTLRVQQLFVQYQSQLKAFALVLSPNFVQADDLMQETFLTITAKAHEFDLESNFLAWSRTILRFKVLEARRAAGVKTVDYLDSLVASCPDQWANEERLHKLTECIQNLAPKSREIILLRYQREHSPSQIAEMLSRTVNSINVALSKARLALRDCMDRQLQTESSQ
ncbi:sigma-70 family RNA polymerase sigma factor [Blastopirellula marina]|uniref:Probable RNA polymerase sigma-70 factor, ECF subfamily protein n=1 Tax=Blastopirellula marina DSM 3645 TaxID=314230 RepID=A3ZPN1_9BACT|nr:sigma-70 family RNA polymerase sigma factor [Blastopirellula marina]EAQ81709.1 probable RNA polymerase sigma-70 factor, ECF subfamily protein [Blastopirellula marina DSM 3645]